MTKEAQLDELMAHMPQEIVACVQTHGFNKLASAVYGIPHSDERAIIELIGTKLASQRQDWSEIVSGLAALRALRG